MISEGLFLFFDVKSPTKWKISLISEGILLEDFNDHR